MYVGTVEEAAEKAEKMKTRKRKSDRRRPVARSTPWTFNEAIRNRYSVRSYQPRPVEQDKLLAVLEAARLAPSGNNRQPWKFVVVRDAQQRQSSCRACCNQAFVGQAPVVIAAVGLMPDRVMSCDVPGDPVDVAIALDHMTLAAAEQGLGTCWIGAFDQDAVRAVLGIPPTAKVIEVWCWATPPTHRGPRAARAWMKSSAGTAGVDGEPPPVADRKTFLCQLITPQGPVLRSDLVSAILPAIDGMLGVLPGRARCWPSWAPGI